MRRDRFGMIFASVYTIRQVEKRRVLCLYLASSVNILAAAS